jgi:membrane protease YdiL (CAAX protease family)
MLHPSLLKTITGFAVLFAGYHAAEYMMLYHNNAVAFLIMMAVYFVAAWLIAKWQGYKGLPAWGITFNRSTLMYLCAGLLTGISLNAFGYINCLYFGFETISYIPATYGFIQQSVLLIFGTFFSSLSEDVLTRGYIYRHFNSNKYPVLFVLLSSGIYVLNHIHRLSEPIYLLYLLLIGIQLAIPLFFTKNIWYTLGCHWAGNIVYHITNTVMHTDSDNSNRDMWVFILFVALLIPVNYLVSKKLGQGEKYKIPALA